VFIFLSQIDPVTEEEKAQVSKALEENFFILSGQEDLWWDSFLQFCKGNYYGACLVLLPLMEHR
jgi:hypothetical protein